MSAQDSPLNSHLSADQIDLLVRARELAKGTFAALAIAGGEACVNRPLLNALGETGLLGHLFREENGAWHTGSSALELCLIREGLAEASTDAETGFALQGLGAYPILQSGRPDLVATWIPEIAAGRKVPAFALSEPRAGTDVASLELTAAPAGDGFRLRGEKIWISNAPDADVYSVFARTTAGAGGRGLTGFAVPASSEGLQGERLTMISRHPIGRLIFDDVYVAPEQVLGEVDRGMRVAMQTLDIFRPSVGAFGIGMAHAAIDATIRHGSTREAFGRPLKDFQAVSHRIAELATRVQAARLLVHNAAAAYDKGMKTTQVAAMAKLLATEVAQEAVDAAVQFHGAAALQEGHLLEHLYRDVRAPRIYEGASEIQREIIARGLFAADPSRG